MRRRTLIPGFAVLVSLVTTAACEDGASPPLPATIEVGVATAGDPGDLDTDGYDVLIDGGAPRGIGTNGVQRFGGIEPGSHTVSLGGVESNCTPEGPLSRSITVEAGQTGRVDFGLSCVPRRGMLRIAVSTTGQSMDPDGYSLEVIGPGSVVETSGRLEPNDELIFPDMPAGSRAVRISDVAGNCQVSGENPRATHVSHGATAAVGFDVVCVAPLVLEVTVTTAGDDIDRDGYTISVVSPRAVRSVPVAVNGSAPVRDLQHGSYDVYLVGAALNCDAAGANPRRVDSPTGGTIQIAFEVTCAPARTLAFVRMVSVDNAEIYGARDDGGDLVRLTDDPAADLDPVWSPNGERIAFASDRDGDFEIHVMEADGTGVVRLTDNGASDRHPTWSPDGTRIAFVSERGGNAEIHVMQADGTGVAQLTTHAGTDTDPAWSPNGGTIAFVRDGSLYTMAPDGTNVRSVAFYSNWYYYPIVASPAWSPDGSRIAFSVTWCDYYYGSGACWDPEIDHIRADGSDLRAVNTGPGAGLDPAWYPDGKKIAATVHYCSPGYPGQPCEHRIRAVRLGVEVIELLPSAGQSPSW